MSHKIDLEYIKQRFQEKGLTPLFTEYTGNRQKLDFKCFCGREDFTTWSYFSTAKDFGCWLCKQNIKGSLEEKLQKLRILLEVKKVSPVEPLIYPKGDSYFSIICLCGEIFQTRMRYLWSVKNNERYKCKKCLSKNLAMDFYEVRSEFLKKGGRPLFQDSDYLNKQSLLRFQCSCGKEDYCSISQIRQIKTLVCESCRKERAKLSLAEVAKRLLDKGFILLSPTYSSIKDKLSCKTVCCGEIREISLENLSKRKKGNLCIQCQSAKRRIPFSYVKQEFEKRGLILLSQEKDYVNTRSKLNLKCICGEEIIRTYGNTIQTGSSGYCEECQFKLTRPRGERHGRFNVNLTDLDRKSRNLQYSTWRNQVLQLFKNKCYISHKEGGNLVIHHLNGRHWKKLDRLYILNAVSISEKIHKEFHAQYGYGNNTEEQFQAFLKDREMSLNPEKLLQTSSFHVRRLLLWFDLKNICKELKIQVSTTDTPYLFHLQKNEKRISIFLMNSRVSPREYLKRLKEKNPDLFILHPRELLKREKRDILSFFLLKQLKDAPILDANRLQVLSVSKEEAGKFIKSNSLQDFTTGEINYALYINQEIKAIISLQRGKKKMLLRGYVEEKTQTIKEGFNILFQTVTKLYSNIYYVLDRRFPLSEEMAKFFTVLQITRPRAMYAKNSIVLKRVNMFKLSRKEKLFKHEKLILRGYSRIYDAGNLITKWSRDL